MVFVSLLILNEANIAYFYVHSAESLLDMKMLKITMLSLFVWLLAQPSEAQKRDLVALADKTFEIGEYFKAIDKYKKAYSKEKDKLRKTEIT